MDYPQRTELGRTVTEMLTVLLVISVIVVLGVGGFRAIHERVVASALQKAIATHQTQRIHEIQGSGDSTKSLTYMGPYKYPFHVENGTTTAGAKSDFYWITIGSFEGNKAKTLSTALCQRLLNELNLPVMPTAIAVNDIPTSVSGEACKYNLNGIVLTLYFPKKAILDPNAGTSLINATYPRACTATSQCGGCQVCENGHCVNDQSKCPAGSTCIEGFCQCSDEREACKNTCCSNNQVCGSVSSNQLECVDTSGLSCSVNEDCDESGKCSEGAGQCYCNIAYTKGYPVTLNNTTKCQKLTDFTYQFQFNGKNFYIGPKTSYWSAENFCLAHGKQLATYESLGISNTVSCDAMQDTCPLYHILKDIDAPSNIYWTHSKHSSALLNRLYFIKTENQDRPPGIYSNAGTLGGSAASYTLCEDKIVNNSSEKHLHYE
ncbi:MAG: hypothetical protein J6Y85_04200 [Alphaproteobacteria bacterium]|nr:hypothetical protein [Alphaproteobacteria bacterium]